MRPLILAARRLIHIDDAMNVLRELLDRRDRGEYSDTEFFHMVAEVGPLTCVEIEEGSAGGTGVFCKLYKASGTLKTFLAAVSARDRDIDNPGKFAACHSGDAPRPEQSLS